MKNSKKNKKPTISEEEEEEEEEEKSLKEWKLPPSSASDFVAGRRGGGFSFLSDWTVNTVEKSIPLSKGYSTFPLFSKHSISTRLYQLLRYSYVHVGMIQVALKPTKLGSNASATVFLRDKRFLKFRSSVLGMVESSLSDGPIYFSYFPSHCVTLSDSSVCFSIDVKVKGDENVTLMYKFHYEVMKFPWLFNMSRHRVDGSGETTLYLTKIGENNRVVSRKIRWDEIGVGEEGSTAENNLASASSSSGEVGHTNIDWKETAEAHVVKVDVPGLEKEEVKVEVEDGRVLKISGERREEDEEDTWHCVERTSGKFLRRLRLPENADMDQLTAEMKNGVLTVTVLKREVVVKNSQVKVISISG